ncbi:tryptophan synthase beta subunit-like PLP-dependent enzyme [Crepidotus variabilis]|uniref:cysteine synthase n=1 Tax=Crepidotus variabilis TaxID=179855 RepID=A0A9P6EDU9_9AGAR|nr:tryptophan synthase beta subunit-like PLP-dependent enzyme [Crepidotus variabilis]
MLNWTRKLTEHLPQVIWPSRTTARNVFIGILLGFSLSASLTTIGLYARRRKEKRELEQFTPRPIELRSDEIVSGVTGLIGNTPLVRINSLSNALGVEILGKAEFLNPGGSVKDRVALRMIDDAERFGYLKPYTGSRIFEGTVGSTGISIATIARARGYDTTIIMPDDVAEEKVKALKALGADVERVRPASIVDKKQYVNLARQRALKFGEEDAIEASEHAAQPELYELKTQSESILVSAHPDHNNRSEEPTLAMDRRGYFADQFENKSNFDAHFNGTGPEIWRQTSGRLDAFVAGAGTGGTVAGVGRYLKSLNEDVCVAIADPDGSGLFNKVKHGVMYDRKESEGTKRRHQVDTVVEGIGINRLTRNIEMALPILDDAFRITDAEAVAMSRYLVKNDGLFLGSSSACNLMACVKLIKQKGWNEGKTVVTILCDSGTRHYSKFWNDEYLRHANIPIDLSLVEDLLQRDLHPDI